MCTDTFLRLPEEKRNRFLQAAWEEFTTASFAEASINQIVRRARVPRGSFYQYFLDKWDLFSDLMGLIRDHFEEEFRKLSIQSGGDLFRTIPLCYDRFVQHGPAADPLFERCLRILRLNSGLFLQLMLSDPRITIAFWRVLGRRWTPLPFAARSRTMSSRYSFCRFWLWPPL
ncbi:MAG: TetR/AcrR family transcriptional regulator [Oscillospiraceae bacterium]